MDEVERFKKIKEKINDISNSKIRIEERYKNQKEKLESLLEEITSQGYDPKNLTNIKEEKEQELKTALDKLESEIEDVSAKLDEVEL